MNRDLVLRSLASFELTTHWNGAHRCRHMPRIPIELPINERVTQREERETPFLSQNPHKGSSIDHVMFFSISVPTIPKTLYFA